MSHKRCYIIYEYPLYLEMKDAVKTGKCKLVMRVEYKKQADEMINRINHLGITKAFYIYG